MDRTWKSLNYQQRFQSIKNMAKIYFVALNINIFMSYNNLKLKKEKTANQYYTTIIP